MQSNTTESVQEYYGQVLTTNNDLRTSACCTAESVPNYLKPILKDIHVEVMEKFYGCGSPIPTALEGKTVLDLGSGSGQDCFVISKLVGSKGRVIGVDMTDAQLEVAKRHIAYHQEKFGFKEPNVEFRKGYIEDLKVLDIADNSIDVVVSNCVLNLSADKTKVFAEIFRVLKPGGELYFSDVFSDRRIPAELLKDPVLLGECLSGALYTEDFRRTLTALGCADFRLINKRSIAISDVEVERKIGMINFFSMTVRAFKMDLEDRCEDYGQVAYYLGGIDGETHAFHLDDHHTFPVNQPVLVCGNTAKMLSTSRFSKYFKVLGDTSNHLGLFDCSEPAVIGVEARSGAACC